MMSAFGYGQTLAELDFDVSCWPIVDNHRKADCRTYQ